ncbi:MAG: hypothetical protein GC160_10665 [Acidobacteria bacterium]|nr:hypothetical protein [Acidobacteriota bacterium]
MPGLRSGAGRGTNDAARDRSDPCVKILLDENIPRSTAAALRELGHDVREICGSDLAGAPDRFVWDLAQREDRVLVTTDKDFAVHRDSPHSGILLVRLRQPNRALIHDRILSALRSELDWSGLFLAMRDRLQTEYRSRGA